jgi:hypothetical protein
VGSKLLRLWSPHLPQSHLKADGEHQETGRDGAFKDSVSAEEQQKQVEASTGNPLANAELPPDAPPRFQTPDTLTLN